MTNASGSEENQAAKRQGTILVVEVAISHVGHLLVIEFTNQRNEFVQRMIDAKGVRRRVSCGGAQCSPLTWRPTGRCTIKPRSVSRHASLCLCNQKGVRGALPTSARQTVFVEADVLAIPTALLSLRTSATLPSLLRLDSTPNPFASLSRRCATLHSALSMALFIRSVRLSSPELALPRKQATCYLGLPVVYTGAGP